MEDNYIAISTGIKLTQLSELISSSGCGQEAILAFIVDLDSRCIQDKDFTEACYNYFNSRMIAFNKPAISKPVKSLVLPKGCSE